LEREALFRKLQTLVYAERELSQLAAFSTNPTAAD
jgi:hypothetical protein